MGDQYLGVIQMVAFTFAPRSFTFCSGQLIPITQNQALFSLVGTYYGGDGRTTFGVPDFRARAPFGSLEMGTGPGLQGYQLGAKVGAQTHVLTSSQLPSHTHTATFTPSGGDPASGTLEAYTSGAGTHTPSAGDYISGGSGAQIFGTGGLGAQLVELAGLSISGGGGGGGTVTVAPAGQSQAFSTLSPMHAVNFVICTEGLYPSRN